jgi:two-component system invasion response regulator UvrY
MWISPSRARSFRREDEHVSQSIKVLLVDDHPVVRTGYRHLLQTDTGIEVVAEANDSASAYAAFKTLVPDVVIMDISLPGVSGIEAMKRMRAHRPEARILIFSMHAAFRDCFTLIS